MTEYKKLDTATVVFDQAPVFRKIARLNAKDIEISDREQEIITNIGGIEETRNTAKIGDHIITGPEGERYILKPEKFQKLYVRDASNPDQFISSNVVRAVQLSEAVSIMAPWGEEQRATAGGWVVQSVTSPTDIYLIEEKAFAKTYAPEVTPNKAAGPLPRGSITQFCM